MGAETPFLRPAEFATDQSLDLPVFRHALEWLKRNEGYEPDIVVQLRPTSPVRPVNLVDDAVRLLTDHPEADSVRGVVPSSENPFKMWLIDSETGTMSGLIKLDGIRNPIMHEAGITRNILANRTYRCNTSPADFYGGRQYERKSDFASFVGSRV
jgi:hypothetical protein